MEKTLSSFLELRDTLAEWKVHGTSKTIKIFFRQERGWILQRFETNPIKIIKNQKNSRYLKTFFRPQIDVLNSLKFYIQV